VASPAVVGGRARADDGGVVLVEAVLRHDAIPADIVEADAIALGSRLPAQFVAPPLELLCELDIAIRPPVVIVDIDPLSWLVY